MSRPRGRLHWLDPLDPDAPFPDPEQALSEPSGLLAIGGDLSPARLLRAYRRGIFPWFNPGEPILWWSPDPRTVLPPERMHRSRSLRRTLRRGDFAVSFDQAFDAVIRACATVRREDTGTWLGPEMIRAYGALHRMGHAHSVEVWRDGRLVGGLYGVSVGAIFCGESMFSAVADASKIALHCLCLQLAAWSHPLIDCQVHSPHLERLGAVAMPRRRFLELLDTFADRWPSGVWQPDIALPGDPRHLPRAD